MALKKVENTEFGYTVEYWKIAELSLNWITKIGRIRLAGYVSEALRQEGKPFPEDVFYNVNPKEYDTYFATGDPRDKAYQYIKDKDPFFQDAENC